MSYSKCCCKCSNSTEMDFFHRWKELSRSVSTKLPTMVIMGDRPFLNKQSCFCGGLPLTSPACCLCDIVLDYVMIHMNPIINRFSYFMSTNFAKSRIKANGLHYDKQYISKVGILSQSQCKCSNTSGTSALCFIGIIYMITAKIQSLATKWYASHILHKSWSIFDFMGVYKDALWNYLKIIGFFETTGRSRQALYLCPIRLSTQCTWW